MRILCLAADASRNPLVRLVPIAKVLARSHEIEVSGFRSQESLFAPYAQEFDYRTSVTRPLPGFAQQVRELARSARADVVYAFKPLSTSLLTGLAVRRQLDVPLLLDIEDWELGWYLDRRTKDQIRHLTRLRQANGLAMTLINERLARRADAVTVASSFLGQRFGGTFLPHGPDTARFDPERWPRNEALAELGLPDLRYVVFAGTPMRNKGVEDLLEALQRLRRPDVRMLVVGSFAHDPAFGAHLDGRYGDVMTRIAPRPHAEMPLFLAVATAVVLAQRITRETEAQMPAKVYEAMAMAVPVVATSVSDLPTVLDGCGVVIPPGRPRALEEALVRLLDDEEHRRQLGRAARARCIARYGWDAMADILDAQLKRLEAE